MLGYGRSVGMRIHAARTIRTCERFSSMSTSFLIFSTLSLTLRLMHLQATCLKADVSMARWTVAKLPLPKQCDVTRYRSILCHDGTRNSELLRNTEQKHAHTFFFSDECLGGVGSKMLTFCSGSLWSKTHSKPDHHVNLHHGATYVMCSEAHSESAVSRGCLRPSRVQKLCVYGAH